MHLCYWHLNNRGRLTPFIQIPSFVDIKKERLTFGSISRAAVGQQQTSSLSTVQGPHAEGTLEVLAAFAHIQQPSYWPLSS